MNNTKHSPLPFTTEHISLVGHVPVSYIYCKHPETEDGNYAVAVLQGVFAQDNAEFIVRACNNHYQLLEALNSALNYLEFFRNGDVNKEVLIDKIRKAIAEAEK